MVYPVSFTTLLALLQENTTATREIIASRLTLLLQKNPLLNIYWEWVKQEIIRETLITILQFPLYMNRQNNDHANFYAVLSSFVYDTNNYFSNESFISFISPIIALFEALAISIERMDNPLFR